MRNEHAYPIREVVRRTGLTPAVLRTWEHRHGVVTPVRSANGWRLYTDADVERLELLHRATQAGFTIGAIAHLSTEALHSVLGAGESAGGGEAQRGEPPQAEELLRLTLEAIGRLDGSRTEDALRQGAAQLPLLDFARRLLAPLLAQVGGKWHSRLVRSAQEGLAYDVIRDVLGDVVGADAARPGAPVLVVATPRGSAHEFGAMLAGAVALSEGWSVLYLGSDLLADRIADSAQQAGASAVALSILYPERDRAVRAELVRLGGRLGDAVPLVVGGSAAAGYAATLQAIGARYLQQVDEMGPTLREIGRGDVRQIES